MKKIFIGGMRKTGSSAVIDCLHDLTGIVNIKGRVSETRLVTIPAGLGCLACVAIEGEKVDYNALLEMNGNGFEEKSDALVKVHEVLANIGAHAPKKMTAKQYTTIISLYDAVIKSRCSESSLNLLVDYLLELLCRERDVVLFNNDPGILHFDKMLFMENAKYLGVIRDWYDVFADHVDIIKKRNNDPTDAARFTRRYKRYWEEVKEKLELKKPGNVAFVSFEDFVYSQDTRDSVLNFLELSVDTDDRRRRLYDEKRAMKSIGKYKKIFSDDVVYRMKREVKRSDIAFVDFIDKTRYLL